MSYRVDLETGEAVPEAYRRDYAGTAGGLFTYTDGRQAAALRAQDIRMFGQRDRFFFRAGEELLRPGERLLAIETGIRWVEPSAPEKEAHFELLPGLEAYDVRAHVHTWRVSPDGSSLVAAIGSDIEVEVSDVLMYVPLNGQPARELYRVAKGPDGRAAEITAVMWTPDASQVFFEVTHAADNSRNQQSEYRIVDLAGGPSRRLGLEMSDGAVQTLRFHPDGVRVVYSTMQHRGELWVANGLPWQGRADR